MKRLAKLVEGQWLDMELDIGAALRRIGAREDAELGWRHRQGASPAQRIVQPHAGFSEQRIVGLVERPRARHLVDGPLLEMVLQIGPDAGTVDEGIDTGCGQDGAGPDAGPLQDLRTAD